MDNKLRLSKELRSVDRDDQSRISSLDIRPYKSSDLVGLAIIFDRYFQTVCRENVNRPIIAGGSEVNGLILRIEDYLSEGAQIRVLADHGTIVGFLVYHLHFDCIMIIKATYIEPRFREQGLLWKMVFNEHPNLKKVFSQSYPWVKRDGLRREKLHENGDLTTWENIFER